LKVACDDGFGWPNNIPLPAWGAQISVKPRGIAWAMAWQDGTEAYSPFNDTSEVASWGQRNSTATRGWAYATELGCWPVSEGL
jgi:hypothetical protein